MSTREQQRVLEHQRMEQGEMTAAEAATALAVSVRPVRRLLAGYRQEGVAARAHDNRGRRPGHTLPPQARQQVLVRATTDYAGANVQHLRDLLASEGPILSRACVRRILLEAGVPSPHTCRRRSHRLQVRPHRGGRQHRAPGPAHAADPARSPRRSDVQARVEYDDMLSPQRQQEIRECVARLKRFQPTKVALEVLADQSAALNDNYRQYRLGTFTLTANERHQLGFRIAADLDHEQVYAIDWQGIIGWDQALSFAREHNQATKLDEYAARAQQGIDELNARITMVSALDPLCDADEPANLERNHQWYMLLALVGEGNQYVGADVICKASPLSATTSSTRP